jgi:phosphoribosyl-dephospho-CoA transferase
MGWRLRRHDLAYLHNGAKISFDQVERNARAWLDDWIASGNPLVVARQRESARAVRLGAMLPLRLGRGKLGCEVAGPDLDRVVPAVAVESVLPCVPCATAHALAGLAARANELGVAVGVYGSTAWEHLSREAYRREDSDVDLICDVSSRHALAGWLDAMERASGNAHGRIDGEIRLPDGNSVAWRELARFGRGDRDNAMVLAKDLRSVALVRVGALLEPLA